MKKETTFDAQCQEEAHTLLLEGIDTNLPACTLSRCGQTNCLLDLLENKQDVDIQKKKTSDA